MFYSIAITLLLMATLCAGWLLVQRLWLRCGRQDAAQVDALAGRTGCGNCGCIDKHCARERDKPDNREADDHAPGRL